MNLGLSGRLAQEQTAAAIQKYAEPADASMPDKRWRLYPFKGEEALPPLHIHRQSKYSIGRDRKTNDIPVDHPSCSKQHAVLQYRRKADDVLGEDGSINFKVKLYIIDLGSTNGTYLNGDKIEALKYYQLLEGDRVKFGFSTRDYIVLHEKSTETTAAVDDAFSEDEQ